MVNVFYDSTKIKSNPIKELSINQRVMLIDLIPNDATSIDGRLCATREMIDSKKLQIGSAIILNGKALGRSQQTGSSECTIEECSYLSSRSNSCFSEIIKRKKMWNINPLNVLTGKSPCGIILNNAGNHTYQDEIINIKNFLKYYVKQGYTIRNLEIGFGLCINTFSDKRENRPKNLSLQNEAGIAIITDYEGNNHLHVRPYARIEWNPKSFKREDFNQAISGLEKIGFKIK